MTDLEESWQSVDVVLLQHAVGGVQLLHVGVVGVEVCSQGGIVLGATVALVRLAVVSPALSGGKDMFLS